MAAEEVADVRDRRAQRTGVTSGNMRAQLSDYIGQVFECKAESPHYSRRGIAHTFGWGASRAPFRHFATNRHEQCGLSSCIP